MLDGRRIAGSIDRPEALGDDRRHDGDIDHGKLADDVVPVSHERHLVVDPERVWLEPHPDDVGGGLGADPRTGA